MLYNEKAELMHHGVPGMKWGRRKSQYYKKSIVAKQRYRTAKKQAIAKATKAVAKINTRVALANIADDVFYGGKGKQTIKQVGRRATEAYLYSRGAQSVRWMD